MLKEKIKGVFLGVAIGDCLGMPVESFSASKIAEKYGTIYEYLVPSEHKWFNGQLAGTYTDDSQLTLCVARSLIENGLDLNAMAQAHVEASKVTMHGWGRTTRAAVRNLANGMSWDKAGLNTGVGNGVAMKIAPLGLLMAQAYPDKEKIKDIVDFIVNLCLTTHATSVAVSSALIQAFSIYYCTLIDKLEKFDPAQFRNNFIAASKVGRSIATDTLTDDITSRMEMLFENRYKNDNLIEMFGGGTSYSYNSIPFTYGFFLNNYSSINSLYDIVSAGGDTDTNGSMLGALLGALHGPSVFPQNLIDGLVQKQEILTTANLFAEKFQQVVHIGGF